MHNSGRVAPAVISGVILALSTVYVFAAGAEGTAMVEPVRWIVTIVLFTFITLIFGGGLRGAMMARQNDISLLRGLLRGMVKGFSAFLVVGAVSLAGITILGVLWILYSFIDVYLLKAA